MSFAPRYCFVLVALFGLFYSVHSQMDSNEDTWDENFRYENGKLIQLAIVTRHGQRTPNDPYPTDPYKDNKYWPEGWLQLTAVGAHQHRILGQRLRSEYNDTIPFIYTSNSVRIRSTGISRTLASAFALTTALFPGQAIPIHSSPSKYDRLFSPHKSCPAFIEEMEKYLATPEIQEEELFRQPFYDWMTERIGKKFDGVDSAEGMYSLLTIERQRGHDLPSWTNDVYPQPLRNLTAVYLTRSSATAKLARLRYGSLLKDILEYADKAGKKTPKKFLLYSAHDFTIVGLLNSMGVFDGQPSGFASSITFEVRSSDSEHGNTIDIFYRNETDSPPTKLHVNGCGEPCHIKKLQDILNHIIPDDIDAECLSEVQDDVPNETGTLIGANIVWIICVFCFSLGCFMVLICTKFCLKKEVFKARLFKNRGEYTEIL